MYVWFASTGGLAGGGGDFLASNTEPSTTPDTWQLTAGVMAKSGVVALPDNFLTGTKFRSPENVRVIEWTFGIGCTLSLVGSRMYVIDKYTLIVIAEAALYRTSLHTDDNWKTV